MMGSWPTGAHPFLACWSASTSSSSLFVGTVSSACKARPRPPAPSPIASAAQDWEGGSRGSPQCFSACLKLFGSEQQWNKPRASGLALAEGWGLEESTCGAGLDVWQAERAASSELGAHKGWMLVRDHQPGLSQGPSSRRVSKGTLETMDGSGHILQPGTKSMSLALFSQISSSMFSWPSRSITWLRPRA